MKGTRLAQCGENFQMKITLVSSIESWGDNQRLKELTTKMNQVLAEFYLRGQQVKF